MAGPIQHATPAPTLKEIGEWPATVEIPKACTAFGISRSHGYALAGRGQFPARVIKVGGRYRVATASILAALGEEGAT
jgi:predicted DNA-binding transcriptional regulator AlpA